MGPFVKSNNKTSKIMFNLLISLIPIILFSFYKNGYIPYKNHCTSFIGMFYPLLFIMVGVLSSLLIEEIYLFIFSKKRGKELVDSVINGYAIFPGLFISLVLPINTPLSILFIACLAGIVLGKMVFGGFGNNIFNPALIGCVFVLTCFGTTISNCGGYLNSYELDAVSSSTPLTNVSLVEGIGSYESLVKPYGSLLDFLIGTIPGAVGETSALLCIVAFIYLTLTKTIKWRISISYVGTVFIVTYVVALFSDLGIWYPLFHILSGGLLFGSVFMATDPVTSPVNKESQVLYGIILGLVTSYIRLLTPYPEGVLTSILLMNMFVFIIDRWGSKVRFKPIKYYITICIAIICAIGMGYYISTTFNKSVDTTDPDYEIISKQENNDEVIYEVSQKGFGGKIKAKIIFRGNEITEINILEHNESLDRYELIVKENYLSTLKKNQKNLGEVDTISSATVSSTALKKMVNNTIRDYTKGKGSIIKEKKKEEITGFKINDVREEYAIDVYNVDITNRFGVFNMDVTMYDGVIKNIRPLKYDDTCISRSNSSDYYKCPAFLNEGYINELIKNQDNLDNVDTISGATISCDTLKEVIRKVKEATR